MKLFFVALASLISTLSLAETISPFNNLAVKTDSTGAYRFIVSGHFHGSGHNRTGLPTNSLLANLDWLNESNSAFVMCLGDLFLDVTTDIPFYEKSLFSKLKMPLFNAVGNHDLSQSVYQDHYGATYLSFEVAGDLHLILDTELNDGSLKNAQLDWFKEQVKAVKAGQYNRVFVYAHRTIWVNHYSELDRLFKDNTQSLLGNNFTETIYPLIQDMSQQTDLYWFAGSLGDAPASFFHFKDGETVTYIATAIRGLKRDAVLIADVNSDGVEFSTQSFTGESLLNLEEYDVAFWNERVGKKPFNYRLIPYYTKNIVTHQHFWYGVGTGILLLLVIRRFRRKKKA